MTTPDLRLTDRMAAHADARPAGACPAAGASAGATIRAVLRHELRNVVRSRWMLSYAAGFLLATEVLLRATGSADRAIVGLLNVVLFVVPLVSVTFGLIYWHSAREFNELLLAQPVDRRALWLGVYLGLALPLSAAAVIGIAFPLLAHRALGTGSWGLFSVTVTVSVMLTFAFAALALLIGVKIEDRLKGIGVALAAWISLTVLYDGCVVLVATVLADYPLERPVMALMLANPVDLARTLIVLRSDAAGMMGYTGAIVERFLGSGIGVTVAILGLAGWIAVPAWLGLRAFERKDF